MNKSIKNRQQIYVIIASSRDKKPSPMDGEGAEWLNY